MKTRNPNGAIAALTTGLALIAGTTLPSTALADAQDNQHFNIEVIVNVLKGTDVTNEKIRDYFRIANEALKCAKINLQILEINENVELGDDNDAISEDEFDDARTTATNELNDDARGANEGKGLKVYFADDVREERPNTNGWAFVCEPFGAVENFMDPDATAEQLCQEVGNILAHEVGHMLGIPGGGTPDDDGVDGDYTDADRKDELMNGWSHRDCDGERTIRGTDLTDAQKARIRCKAGERGTAVVKDDEQTPAERDRTEQSGGAINPDDSSVPGAPGIRKVSLFSDSFEPCFELSLITRGVFDPTDFAQYTVALDIDNDPATGQPFGPLQGADRLIDIIVEGFGGAFAQGFDLNDARRFCLRRARERPPAPAAQRRGVRPVHPEAVARRRPPARADRPGVCPGLRPVRPDRPARVPARSRARARRARADRAAVHRARPPAADPAAPSERLGLPARRAGGD